MDPDKRKRMFAFRATSDEIGGVWMPAAERAGLTLSAWIRDRLNAAAKREARAAAQKGQSPCASSSK